MSEHVKKVLMVTYVFPPIPYAGTHRSVRLCKEFQKQGVETHVLTINIYDDIPNDHKLLDKIPAQVFIHRTPTIDPWRWFQNWKKHHKNLWCLRHVNKMMSFFLWFFNLPDHMALWVPFAFIRGMKIIRQHNIETVYVSSPPHSTQIIGCLLKKFTGVRLIADFRDPIIGNAYCMSFNDNKSLRSRIERDLGNRLEYLIAACADKIVVNTETHRREMMERHEKDIFVTVRNSFDKSDYDGIDGRRYDTFTIAHVGSIYGLRRPDVILRAIKHLDQTRGTEQLRLQVLFVGLNEPHLMEMIEEYGVERYVKILPMISHHEAIEIMVHSHLLLMIKATGPGSLGQIPGKFFEYVGTGNRIIFLGPLESEVAGIIKEINAGVVFKDDVKKLADFMSREYDAFLAGETKRVMPKDIDIFSSEYMASKLIELL